MSNPDQIPMWPKGTTKAFLKDGIYVLTPHTLFEARGALVGAAAGLGVAALALIGLTYVDTPNSTTEMACSSSEKTTNSIEFPTCQETIDDYTRVTISFIAGATILGGFAGGVLAHGKEEDDLRKLRS